MTQTDRNTGLRSNTGIKQPVRVATTAAIVLSGEQTIDGVACVTGDRVLVKNQATTSQNGIYDVDTGAWERSADFDGANDVVKGTMILVAEGATLVRSIWLVGQDDLTIGTDAVSFTQITNPLAGVSAFIQTLLDDATALLARQTLLLDKHGADIPSPGAGTLDLDAATGDLVDVTGVNGITAITLAEGVEKTVRFTGILTLTHSATLVLPGAANITTAAGDIAVFRGYAAGIVRCVDYPSIYLKLAGGTLTGALTGTSASFSGAVTAGGLLDISGAAAGQIKFPATQNPSADANTLDDYEEGTYTPVLGGTATYTANTGNYVKVGRIVHMWGRILVNVLGTGSTTLISGMPFSAADTNAPISVDVIGSATAIVSAIGWMNNATMLIYSRVAASAGRAGNAIFGNGQEAIWGGTYKA